MTTLFALLTWSIDASAEMPIVKRTLVEGGYAITGNDFMDCQSGTSCLNNTSALVPVDVDSDATTSVSSSANLTLPTNATVVSAFLVVTQTNSQGTEYDYPANDSAYSIKLAFNSGSYVSVPPQTVTGGGTTAYRARYDITNLIAGSGTYTVADMPYAPPSARNVSSMWYIVVIYEQPGAPLRSVTEYGPMDKTCYKSTNTATMEFTTPATGTPEGLLTLFASDGHKTVGGVSGTFGSLTLTNSENPPDNIANSTVSDPNGPITRNPSSFVVTESADIDVYDVSSALTNSQTNETLSFTCSGGDGVWWTGAVFSVDVVAPVVTAKKTVVDLNGGVIELGDVLEYTIHVSDEAKDNAVNMVLKDTLPPELTYVPGTLQISSGANQGSLTDTAGDDQGEVSGQDITVRLGTGADASSGGTLTIGESTEVKFRAKFTTPPASGNQISNQARIEFAGASTGTAVYTSLSSPSVGSGPTTNPVEFCGNGNVYGSEACDDGNNVDGDGCNSVCLIEDGYACTSDAQCAGGFCLSGICSSNAAPSITSNGGGDTAALSTQENSTSVTTVTATDPNAGDSLTYSISGGSDQGAFSIDPATGALTFKSAPDAETPTDSDHNNTYEVTVQVCDDGSPKRCDTQTITVTVNNIGCATSTDCSGTTPVCNTASDVCEGCSSDANCGGSTPACQPSGACGQCSATNTSLCSGATPLCETTSGTCVQCLTDANCTDYLNPTCVSNQCTCQATGNEVCGNLIDENCDGAIDEGCTDSDGDGLGDELEKFLGSDPNDADTDDDGVADGDEPDFFKDTDGDGLSNILDPDSDNDGLYDGTEMGKDCSNPATDASKHHCIADADDTTATDPLDADTDDGGVIDGSEDANLDGKLDTNELDPTTGHDADDNGVTDTDGDGLSDALENFLGSDPNDADTDDDGVLDGDEPNFADDTDGDGVINVLDADSDNDGLFDGTEMGKNCENQATDTAKNHCVPDADDSTTTSPVVADTDHGGVTDGSEDANLDGKLDANELDPTSGHKADDSGVTDSDGDGLSDELEKTLGTDPNDADTDDDGLLDGEEANPAEDSDGDGLINALDPDSDNDGLFDGTEMGKDCSNQATDMSKHQCIADADPNTTTSPLLADTDGGGALDGSEDANLNGKVDGGEQDPTAGHADDDANVTDTDGDGLSDALETFLGTNPNDADTDDDGVTDGAEPNFSVDSDGDGLLNVLDEDSDNDGLFDGTELGLDCSNQATDANKNHCVADADDTTTTNPLLADTDGGGASDGSEDANLNGKLDSGEQDPTGGHADDDADVTDTDGDGLSDALESFLGTDPNDADTDDDGVRDGLEPNPNSDTDGDGDKNASDEDSDGDGLFDGTEMGLDCSDQATDTSKNHCVADADSSTTTSPLLADTDHGGLTDGAEDTNHDGKVDTGETDPNDKTDDKPCQDDASCGDATSGRVCDTNTHKCIDGCRGQNGNGCPTGEHCSSTDESIGQCQPDQDGGAGGSAGAAGAAGSGGMAGSGGAAGSGGTNESDAGQPSENDNLTLEGGGCSCSLPSTGDSSGEGMLALAALGLGAALLRRRRDDD